MHFLLALMGVKRNLLGKSLFYFIVRGRGASLKTLETISFTDPADEGFEPHPLYTPLLAFKVSIHMFVMLFKSC